MLGHGLLRGDVGAKVCIWTPDIPATAAEFVVETASGVDVVTVNQRQGGGVWNLLGSFALDAGTGNRIVLNASTVRPRHRNLYAPRPSRAVAKYPIPKSLPWRRFLR